MSIWQDRRLGADPARWFAELDSTNAQALRLIVAGALAGPTWIVAGSQSGGRGRLGRQWLSPTGNFYGSFAMPAPLPLLRAAQLGFAAALSVAETVEQFAATPARCKWPNDVLVDGAKIAGILLETTRGGDDRDWVVVGIGINVATTPAGDLRRAATALGQWMRVAPDPMAVGDELARRFGHWRQNLALSGFARLQAAFMARGFGIGAKVAVDGQPAVFLGIDDQGAARLKLDSGAMKAVHAGEIRFPDRDNDVIED